MRTGKYNEDRQLEVRAYIVQHDADKHVEGYSEEVDDGGAALFWHILAAHLHHAGPENADACLKHTEGYQLDLAFEGDPCQQVSSASGNHNLMTAEEVIAEQASALLTPVTVSRWCSRRTSAKLLRVHVCHEYKAGDSSHPIQ